MTDAGPPLPPPSLPAGWSSGGPPPSAPVTAEAYAPASPPSAPRKRWIVVLIGTMVLIVGIAIAGTVLFVDNTWPPLDTAYAFTNDLQDGDVDDAYANLCDRLRGPGGRGDFGDFADDFLDGLLTISVNPFGVDRDGDRASVDFTANYRGSRHVDLELTLVHERGDWRVCDVRYN